MASKAIRVTTTKGFSGVIKLEVRDFVPDWKRRHVDPAPNGDHAARLVSS